MRGSGWLSAGHKTVACGSDWRETVEVFGALHAVRCCEPRAARALEIVTDACKAPFGFSHGVGN